MIVLASASPRRKELLSFITTDFKIVPADIDETVENNVPLEKRPEYLAVKKALHISKNGYEKDIVIGCDTGVFIDGNYFNVVGLPVSELNRILKKEYSYE